MRQSFILTLMGNGDKVFLATKATASKESPFQQNSVVPNVIFTANFTAIIIVQTCTGWLNLGE